MRTSAIRPSLDQRCVVADSTIRALVASALAACAVTAAPDARAFCRTTTSAVPADFSPTQNHCWSEGLPLWWKNACVSYDIQQNASRQITYEDARSNIAIAFSQWTARTCPTDDAGASRVSIDVVDKGKVDCNQVQYNSDQPNQHVILFRDDAWPHNDSSNTLALTTVTFNPDTGEIYDADMEINTASVRMSVGDPVPSDGFDFLSVVTHETGHFLGMAHSGDVHATMYAHYTQGSTYMRALSPDDIAGICTIYPPDGTRTVDKSVSASGSVPEGLPCDPTPRHGFSSECATTQTKGCAIAPPTEDAGAGGGALAMAGAALLIMMRRRRVGSETPPDSCPSRGGRALPL
jgi:MYXO-CTERM domain-containing protein